MDQYDAVFQAGDKLYAITFNDEEDAQRYAASCGHDLPLIGIARRVGPTQLLRIATSTDWLPQPLEAAGNRRLGHITRWHDTDTHGFITDTDGHSWFVSIDDIPEGHDYLPVGTEVTFSGSPSPANGKRYSRAYSIKIND